MASPNATATPEQRAIVDVWVPGRTNLYIADGMLEGAALFYFGEQSDDTPITTREFFNDVPGDSHGGPNGPPIERQVLGRIINIGFTLSTWSQEIREWLENHNFAYQYPGVIQDFEIGTPLLSRHRYRLLIVGIRANFFGADPANAEKNEDWFCSNYPCAILSSPVEINQGTKYAALRFTMEGHRVPPLPEDGDPQPPKRGIIWDRDIDGLAAAQTQQAGMQRAAMAAVMPSMLNPNAEPVPT